MPPAFALILPARLPMPSGRYVISGVTMRMRGFVPFWP